ncbi:MAG: translation initiation factor IF-2 [Alphaproteobacteria bacterium]|nr:translation initiation factor IF-2 [Alphaproteobacteria bacterium]
MSDSKDGGGKLTLGKPKTLELRKTVESGQVRQSFSHGRSKTVKVEKKRKRTFERNDAGKMQRVTGEAAKQPDDALGPDGLSKAERDRRLQALAGAAKHEEERRLTLAEQERRTEEQRRLREEEQRRVAEEEEKRAAAEAARIAAEEAKLMKAEDTTGRRAPAAAPPADKRPTGPAAAKPRAKETADDRRPTPPRSKGEPRRRQGKLTISQALDIEDLQERGRSLAALKRAREREKQQNKEMLARSEKVIREVVVPEAITVADLANRMAERGGDVVKALMKLGVMATVNQVIDADTAELIISEFGHKMKRVSESDVEDVLNLHVEDAEEDMKPRPPVVTVMGHVDHGKTSLLDALRATDVVSGEAGGITQHIGAYQVNLSSGEQITFLDTPGHEAFTAMRQRGASATDIVVLVVAADDGVQPQTVEAINHAKAAEVPIIVAINKCDRAEAEPDRIRNELLQHELIPEEMGGDIITVEVSATQKMNLDKLEEYILLQAELLELKANPDRRAEGVVVEAKLEKGRGSVATVLIQHGTLKVGDAFVAGAEFGRVRALIDDKGRNVKQAGPSAPVEVLGLQGSPSAGDEFAVLEDEAKAREISEFRQRKARDASTNLAARGTLEQMFSQIKAGEIKEVPMVIKTDVQGSLEAIQASLDKLGTDEVKVRVLHGAVGGITESDIVLAASTGGAVIGFNVRANPQARDQAQRDGVDIRYYSVIYDLIDDAKQLMGGMLAPERRENFLGYAEIREVFNISKVGKIGGCMVTEGQVKRGAKVRLLRDNVVIHEGSLKQLKRFKDDVREVQHGYECGMAFENYDDIREGDMIECFEIEEVARAL